MDYTLTQADMNATDNAWIDVAADLVDEDVEPFSQLSPEASHRLHLRLAQLVRYGTQYCSDGEDRAVLYACLDLPGF